MRAHRLLSMKSIFFQLSLKFKLAVLVILMLLVGAGSYLIMPKPELTLYKSYSNVIFDRQDKLLRISLASDDRYRLFTPIAEIAESIQKATILYEDQNYYQHSGVDYLALTRAFWQTYILNERRIGASTIVMQVARMRWDITTSSPLGKIEQIFRALQLARYYSKSELLEVYLNLAPYGGNIEGIGAASLIYFNKPASQLNIAEALSLAVVPQNPSKRNPASKQGMSALQPAKQRLIERWIEQYPADLELLKASVLPLSIRKPRSLPYHAPHFVQYVLSTQLHSSSALNRNIKDNVIKSTLDLDLQVRMEKVLASYIDEKKSIGFSNASALLLNTKSMHIEAMIGSADFNKLDIQGQVNGTLAKRSPGSTLKPFVYGLAIDAGIIHPMTMLKDLPKRYAGFAPENFGKGFVGPISAQDALITSRNVPAVELQSQLIERKEQLVGNSSLAKPSNVTKAANASEQDPIEQGQPRTFYEFLISAGISQLKEPDFYGLALALGGAEVSMLELVELYAMIANLGMHKSVVSTYGGRAYDDSKTDLGLLSAEASYLIFDMLSKNPRPSRVALSAAGQSSAAKAKVAWKTGTSWAFRDAWAVAIAGDYVLAVWIGNFNGQGNNAFVGRSAAGPLLFKLLDVVMPNNAAEAHENANAFNQAGMPKSPFDTDIVKELNLKSVDICTSTGDLYEAECPNSEKTLFIPGVSPIKNTNIYRKIWIDSKTGLRVCDDRTNNRTNSISSAKQEVFAFWPTDFQRLFEQAGIYIERPPSFGKDCAAQASASVGRKPSIYSPQQGVEYATTESQQNYALIPLHANADADASRLYWFANNVYIGSFDLLSDTKQAPLMWKAKAGEYDVQLSDDLGRSAFVAVKVKAVK